MTLKLEKGGIIILSSNNACKVHGIGRTGLKMFGDHEFLLHNARYVLELRRILLFISKF